MKGMRVVGLDEVQKMLRDAQRDFGTAKPWVAGARAEYAPDLEFGTARVAARPFLNPSVDWAVARGDSLAKEAAQHDRPLQTLIRLLATSIEGRMKAIMPGVGPSAPGEPPAVDTGNLINSIFAEEL